MTRQYRYKAISLILALVLISVSNPLAARSQDPVPNRIESEDGLVGQVGNWTGQTTSAASGGSYLYSSGSENDVLSLEFTGTSVEVMYVSGPNLGTLAIEVDSTVLRTVITTADATQYAQSAKVAYLSDEPHTLKVYAQAGGIIAVDAFDVTSEVESTPPAALDTAPDVLTSDPNLATLNHVIINEAVFTNDGVELFNPTNVPVNMTGWTVRIYLNNVQDFIFTFPTFVLYPGAYVEIYESAGTSTATVLYANDLVTIDMHFNNAISLQNNLGAGVDFVRWGGSTITPVAPDTWTGSPTFPPTAARSLGRIPQNDDDNTGNDWAIQCSTMGKFNGQCLRLNEFFTGPTDAIEIFNPTSENVNLTGYQFTSYSGVATVDGTYTFPAGAILPAGGYFLVYEGAGTNTATTFYAGFSFGWTHLTGGGNLTSGVGGISLDFARWGTTTVVPAGVTFSGPAVPSSNFDYSVARAQVHVDTDRTVDFCAQYPSLGSPNRSGCVVINEIFNGGVSYVEIYNASLAPYNLANWSLITYNGPSDALDVTYTFPAFSLERESYVSVIEGTGSPTNVTLYTGAAGNFDWAAGGDSGSVVLVNEVVDGVDFVRFGNSTSLGIGNVGFVSPNPPALPSSASNQSLARSASSADFDSGGDWCLQNITNSYNNYGCAARLALFLPSSQFVSLVDSAANPPAPNDYLSYAAGAPAATVGGQWVMGDWDGDGDETPGVYATNGVFYTTNQYGPTSQWTETWFGLFGGAVGNMPVVGHFESSKSVADCLGVMDSQNFPPFGIAFALYYTCNTSGGNPAKTVQWNSVLLPDSAGFSGTYQVGAGDFDLNFIDTIAVRRGPYVTWTNVNPNIPNGTFPNAQFIGAPEATASSFVVGDWDSNGISGFGLFYPSSGILYFRNDLQFNSGVYGGQAVGLPLGPTATATTWEGY